ncbi:MAG: phosphatidylserine decarboxylase family protein [Bacteroidales bacterium]|nr:phosphatidylserine decarboxylase family protein [Bacteroidales bacterium]
MIAGFFIVLAIIGLVIWAFTPLMPIFKWIISGALFIFWMLIVQFFRLPKRKMLIDKDGIVCPADGKVVVIEQVEEKQYLNCSCIQISVFMSPLNVHVNRYPIGGYIEKSVYKPGKFLVAWDPKSSEDNEMHSVVLRHENGHRILVKQIAGAVARRIVNYSKEGYDAMQCDELGFIKFGSRVDVLIPVTSKVEVKLDEVVRGGQTLLARF